MPFKNKEIDKKYHNDYHRLWYERNKKKRQGQIAEYMKSYRQTLKHRYVQYKNSAKRKGLMFDISYPEFEKIVKLNCYYCGDGGGGVDRIDNSLGYIKENTVPCCSLCNYMKKEYLVELFIGHCKKIADFWSEK